MHDARTRRNLSGDGFGLLLSGVGFDFFETGGDQSFFEVLARFDHVFQVKRGEFEAPRVG